MPTNIKEEPVAADIAKAPSATSKPASMLRRLFGSSWKGGSNSKAPRQINSDMRALESAVALRSLMFGAAPAPQSSNGEDRPSMNRIKSDLLNPQLANKVIARLRVLPSSATPQDEKAVQSLQATRDISSASPIHAVCLDYTDEEADEKIFSQLPTGPSPLVKGGASSPLIRSVAYADAGKVISLFKDTRILSFLEAPDLGFGQPVNGEGLLAGSVPAPSTLSDGITQIAQQFLSLGFATSDAASPDHSAVYPPLDRMSILTYWWGLEIAIPPPSMRHLSKAESIQHTVLNFLSAVALVNGGVQEALPFIRYISQYIEYEWTAIKAQDKGKGVVCAATWILPVALVPRAWDFPSKPPPTAATQAPLSNPTPNKVEVSA